eukprot:scaffold24585_cov127-Cylindrotheca_fusiformis.AAC.1
MSLPDPSQEQDAIPEKASIKPLGGNGRRRFTTIAGVGSCVVLIVLAALLIPRKETLRQEADADFAVVEKEKGTSEDFILPPSEYSAEVLESPFYHNVTSTYVKCNGVAVNETEHPDAWNGWWESLDGEVPEGCQSVVVEERELDCDRDIIDDVSCYDSHTGIIKYEPGHDRSCRVQDMRFDISTGDSDEIEYRCDSDDNRRNLKDERCKKRGRWDWDKRDYRCPFADSCKSDERDSYLLMAGLDGTAPSKWHGKRLGDDEKLHLHAWWLVDNRRYEIEGRKDIYRRTAIRDLENYQRVRYTADKSLDTTELSVLQACERQNRSGGEKLHIKGYLI